MHFPHTRGDEPGGILRAVLVTPDQFEKRFLDWQAEEKKQRLFKSIQALRKAL